MRTDLGASERALVAFLRARLDEDEAVIRGNEGGSAAADGYASHFSRDRMLREVQVKRDFIGYLEYSADKDISDVISVAVTATLAIVCVKEFALRIISMPYVDHPDYRQEWAPYE